MLRRLLRFQGQRELDWPHLNSYYAYTKGITKSNKQIFAKMTIKRMKEEKKINKKASANFINKL